MTFDPKWPHGHQLKDGRKVVLVTEVHLERGVYYVVHLIGNGVPWLISSDGRENTTSKIALDVENVPPTYVGPPITPDVVKRFCFSHGNASWNEYPDWETGMQSRLEAVVPTLVPQDPRVVRLVAGLDALARTELGHVGRVLVQETMRMWRRDTA